LIQLVIGSKNQGMKNNILYIFDLFLYLHLY